MVYYCVVKCCNNGINNLKDLVCISFLKNCLFRKRWSDFCCCSDKKFKDLNNLKICLFYFIVKDIRVILNGI